ncbi:LamB/YcsF family protein [Nocardioides daejeonensis]|uniref:LamB/YcsF family protein n=1 Tax=Nocardioides daejeonensis TaxID=1046556 RepID=UPI000D742FDC|nr:5-oxoprolinase subunit PxpA [Nocardioides daejeonensis]
MRTIDLNADLGEEITDDDALLAVVTSANVACGFHAGNDGVMRSVCEGAAAYGVVVGAQVSYRDREHFGRRRLDIDAGLLAEQVAEQVDTLRRHAAAAGTRVAYVKPHGALYNRVVEDAEQAAAVLAGSGDLPVLGLPGGVLLDQAAAAGRRTWREGFPDRGYTSEGRLVPRDLPGALVTIEPEIVAGALRLAREVDSLCLHGDSPGAVDHARAVRRALEQSGWTLAAFEVG